MKWKMDRQGRYHCTATQARQSFQATPDRIPIERPLAKIGNDSRTICDGGTITPILSYVYERDRTLCFARVYCTVAVGAKNAASISPHDRDFIRWTSRHPG